MEEEFFLVDPVTRDLVAKPDEAIFEECARRAGVHMVVPEFLRSQIETAPAVCHSVADLRKALCQTRAAVLDAAASDGAQAIAASLHPFAAWSTQVVSVGRRYQEFALTCQEAVRRLIIGGMHVHVGFGDNDSRPRFMTALRRHLPLLHALSGSSPFHGGRETGFKSYGLTIFGGLPRTGIPRPLSSWQEFDALARDCLRMDSIQHPGELWWDIRPSHAYPYPTVFRVRLQDGASARVYILIEHKAQADAGTPPQLLRYMLRLWLAELESGELPAGRLPLIIPIVLCNGREPWTVPRSIPDMIVVPEGLEHLAREFGSYVLHDLSRRAEGKTETLTRQLERRFGRLPAEFRVRIAAAGLEQLDRWLDAVLEAPTIETASIRTRNADRCGPPRSHSTRGMDSRYPEGSLRV